MSVLNGQLSHTTGVDLQTDMREFFNAPNGLPKQSQAVNGKHENDPSQSPLGGRTVSYLLKLAVSRSFLLKCCHFLLE